MEKRDVFGWEEGRLGKGYLTVLFNFDIRYSRGVLSPGRHVRTRLYFTSESHVHSLLSVFRYGGLLDVSILFP